MKVLKGDAKLQFESLKKTNQKFDVSIGLISSRKGVRNSCENI